MGEFLVLDGWKVSVGKKGQMIEIRYNSKNYDVEEDKPRYWSVKNIDGILADSRVQISAQAESLLAQEGIPIFRAKGNKIIGIFLPYHAHASVIVRRQQYEAYTTQKGVNLAKAFVLAGLTNKANLLRSFARNRKESDPTRAQRLFELAEEIAAIKNEIQQLPHMSPDRARLQIMGLEGKGTKLYYEGLQILLPPRFNFKGRIKHPAVDPVNSLLSYGYIILDTRVLSIVLVTGLDPYGGFLHADRSGKPSLALDITEEFRQPIVDRVVLDFCMNNNIDPEEDFMQSENGRLLIRDKPRKLFLTKLFERFETKITFGPNNLKKSYLQIIFHQCNQIKRYLLGTIPNYAGFTSRW